MDIWDIVSSIGRSFFRIFLFELICYFIGLIILTPLYLFDVKRIHQKHSHDFISYTGMLIGISVILVMIAIN